MGLALWAGDRLGRPLPGSPRASFHAYGQEEIRDLLPGFFPGFDGDHAARDLARALMRAPAPHARLDAIRELVAFALTHGARICYG